MMPSMSELPQKVSYPSAVESCCFVPNLEAEMLFEFFPPRNRLWRRRGYLDVGYNTMIAYLSW